MGFEPSPLVRPWGILKSAAARVRTRTFSETLGNSQKCGLRDSNLHLFEEIGQYVYEAVLCVRSGLPKARPTNGPTLGKTP